MFNQRGNFVPVPRFLPRHTGARERHPTVVVQEKTYTNSQLGRTWASSENNFPCSQGVLRRAVLYSSSWIRVIMTLKKVNDVRDDPGY